MSIKTTLKSTLISISLILAANASAETEPTTPVTSDPELSRGSICDNGVKDKTANYLQQKKQECINEHRINTENNFSLSKYFSSSDDAGCDLGMQWPSLPDMPSLDFDLDICSLMQDMTSGYVSSHNSKMSGYTSKMQSLMPSL
ncbi:hypothetical protein AB4254_11300 [Vibrio breoganii]